MKKWLIILAAVMAVWTAAAFAENLSGMTDEELLDLYQDLLDEMAYRGLSAGQEADDAQTAVTERVLSFFHAWNKNDFDEMLTLCDSGWKAAAENPKMELFRIMANRTALSFEIESIQEIAGEGPDGLPYDMVTATSVLDRNNGMPPKKYRLRFLVRKEEDGLWYINPDGLDELEKAEEEIPAEATAVPGGDADAAMADPVLYYQPDGGEYYHLDQNCKCIHPTFLPLQGVFLYSELNDEPYRNLKPCEICGAPLAPEGEGSLSETGETDQPSFRTFGEALEAPDGSIRAYTVTSEGYAAALIEEDGRFWRAVAFLDERGQELYAAYQNAWGTEGDRFPEEEYNALDSYLMTLPVQYTEELAVIPFTQEELDEMAGKTIGEVMSEPWEIRMCNYPQDAEAGKEIIFPMEKGFCEYELVIDEPFEVYQERRAGDRYDPVTIMSLENYLDLTVRCVRYTGISTSNALNLSYQADGTIQYETELFTEDYDYDLMVEIADELAAVWEKEEPDQEMKEAIIAELTEEHPEAAEMIRQIVESFQ